MRIFFITIFLIFTILPVSSQENYVPNELLIQLNPKFDSNEFFRKVEIDNQVAFDFTCISKPINIYQIQFLSEVNLNDWIKKFYFYPEVLVVQKNHYVELRETIPNDTLFPQQWHLKNIGQTGGTPGADMNVTEAWDITTGGLTTHDDTIVVCIIEGGGVDISHIDLQENIWKNYGEIPGNGIDDDGNGYVDDFLGWNVQSLDDAVGSGTHGTRVAGMVGAKGNNITGISGVNHNVKMMIIKGQVASNEASVIAAYTYPLEMRKLYNETFGAKGAFVVVTNSSWGLNNGDPANSPLWCAMYDTLGRHGIINVGATTNNNVNVDEAGDLPTTCPSTYLIGVTMSNNVDLRAGSGYGVTHVDLAAPGSSVLSTIPGGFYSTASGTSFACPAVSGAIALLYSVPCPDFINYAKAYPDSAALKIRHFILDNVHLIPTLTTEVATGGRLDVNASVLDMVNTCNTNTCIAPYNIAINQITDSLVDVTWQGFSTDFLFYIQENGGSLIEIESLASNTIEIDTLKPCTNYTIWVKAICGAETSDFSYPIFFKTDGCCENPSITELSKTENSIEIQWNAILYATEYNVRYKKESESIWVEELDVVSPFLIEDLDTCSQYEFQILTQCADSTRGYSPSYLIKTKGCGACFEEAYCPVLAANSNTEWIDTVIIGAKKVGTGNNSGWLINENIEFSFLPNSSQTITLIPGYSGFNFTERFSVWIDLNHDGVFDASEKLVENLTNNGPVTGLLQIPTSATLGITKMRIGMNGQANPVECPSGTTFFGEYEDYCVYIGMDASLGENKHYEINIYPNPTQELFYISSSEFFESIVIYNQAGKIVKTIEGQVNEVYMGELPVGIYFVQIIFKDQVIIRKIIKN